MIGLCYSALGQINISFEQFLTDQQLMPRSGPNSCYIDPQLADDPQNLIGSLVTLPTSAPNASDITGTAEPLINFRMLDQKVTVSPLTETWNIIYDQTLTKQASASLSFLSYATASMEKNDKMEVKIQKIYAARSDTSGLNLTNIQRSFKNIPQGTWNNYGVILSVKLYLLSSSMYTEKQASVGGGYYGVQVGGKWLYKAGEDRNRIYVIAEYAPVNLMLTMASTNQLVSIQDINTAISKPAFFSEKIQNQVMSLNFPANENGSVIKATAIRTQPGFLNSGQTLMLHSASGD